jgi:hypothetical protein
MIEFSTLHLPAAQALADRTETTGKQLEQFFQYSIKHGDLRAYAQDQPFFLRLPRSIKVIAAEHADRFQFESHRFRC